MSTSRSVAPFTIILLLFAALAPSWVLAQGQSEGGWQRVNQAIVEGHIIPRYLALQRTTSDLDAFTGRFCSDPQPKRLEYLRRLFGLVQSSWASVQHIGIGPVEWNRRRYRIQLWPDKHGTAAKQIRALLKNADLVALVALEAEGFRGGSVAVQGLTALERLLFPMDKHKAEHFRAGEDINFRCALIAAIGANLVQIADSLVTDWTEGEMPYPQVIYSPGPENPEFQTHKLVSSLLQRDLITGLEVITRFKLDRPMADEAAKAKPKRAEAWRSARSMALISDNLGSLRHLYMTGFSPVSATDPVSGSLDARIRQAFDAASTAAAAVGAPLAEAAADAEQRPALDALMHRTLELQRLISDELPDALQLPVGFNSLDGD